MQYKFLYTKEIGKAIRIMKEYFNDKKMEKSKIEAMRKATTKVYKPGSAEAIAYWRGEKEAQFKKLKLTRADAEKMMPRIQTDTIQALCNQVPRTTKLKSCRTTTKYEICFPLTDSHHWELVIL